MPGPIGFRPYVQQVPAKALGGYDGVRAGLDARQSVKDLPGAVKDLRTQGLRQGTIDAFGRVGQDARNPTWNLNFGGKAKVVAGGFDLVRGAAQLPGQFGSASSSVRQAARTGSRGDIAGAVSSVAGAGSSTASFFSDGFTTAQTANKLYSSYTFGRDAFAAAAPRASPALASAAGRAAATQAFQGATRATAIGATRIAATAAQTATSSVSRSVLKTASKEAAEAALVGAARASAGTLARAGGRFVPGANVAIAGFDSAVAGATWADPNARMGKKIANTVTAVGSVASATNIPVVSQIGAGVSAVSGFISSYFF